MTQYDPSEMYNVQLSNLLIFREESIYHVYTEFISKNIFNLLRDVRKQWYVSLRISINYLDSRENKTNCFPREHTLSAANVCYRHVMQKGGRQILRE